MKTFIYIFAFLALVSCTNYITTGDVNLRKCAGSNCGVVKVVKAKTTVSVSECVSGKGCNSSCWAKLSNGSGYLCKLYLKEATTGTTNPGSCTTKYTKGELNVRNGKGTSYKVLRVLAKGAKVCAYVTSESWWKLSDGGYVSASYLINNPPSNDVQPVVGCIDKNVFSKISQATAKAAVKNLAKNTKNLRERVVAIAKYLVNNFYALPYFGEGGHAYDESGDFAAVINPNWGKCKKLRISTSSYQKEGKYYNYGLDCSGYINWAMYQAGKHAMKVANGWGEAGKQIDISKCSDSRVKAGDLVWKNHHIGIIISKSGNTCTLAEESGHNYGLRTDTTAINKSGFTKIILMDSYYK